PRPTTSFETRFDSRPRTRSSRSTANRTMVNSISRSAIEARGYPKISCQDSLNPSHRHQAKDAAGGVQVSDFRSQRVLPSFTAAISRSKITRKGAVSPSSCHSQSHLRQYEASFILSSEPTYSARRLYV